MSDDATPKPAKKKGKLGKLLVFGLGGLLLIGGGIGAGFYAAGIGLGAAKAKEAPIDPNAPKLLLKTGKEVDRPDPKEMIGDTPRDPSKYKASYYNLEQPFTSNLRDSDGFAQVSLGVSTYYDQKVLDNFKDNEMPIRSAILMTLSNQDAFVIETPAGKDQLRKELTASINKVLKSRTGYGGVDDVYFSSFIIQ